MNLLQVILAFAATVAALGVMGVVAWLLYAAWLVRVERVLARRKGLYREVIEGLASRERALLEPELRQLRTLRDFEALEALLEEQARGTAQRPAWLLDTFDRLGLVDRYVTRLRTARRWRERAFAAELLGRVGNANAVGALLQTVQATRTEDADVREIALRALARIADPRAVEPLIVALRQVEGWLAPRVADILARHGDAVVEPMIALLAEPGRHPARAWAANILGEIRAPRAFPALVTALRDQDDEVRSKAAGALGRLGDRRAVPYLLEHLLSDPAPFVRARIAGALGQFADHEVIDRLVRALGDPAWWVRMRSVEALEQVGPLAEEPLTLALDDPDPEIRIRAAVGLERLGVPARLVAALERGEAPPEATALLTKFGLAGARELLAELLHHPAPAVRTAVVAAIAQAERRDLGPELIERARTDTDPTVRGDALRALTDLAIHDAVPAALEALGAADERVRAAGTALLGQLGGPELASVIQPRSTDRDPSVRAAAARALGLTHAPGAEGAFSRLLRDPDPAVRTATAEGVASAGWRGAGPFLVELLTDSFDTVRTAAAQALGELGDASAVPHLARAYHAAGPEEATAIVVALARLDPQSLMAVVTVLLTRDDTPARVRLVRTLAGLRLPLPAPLLALLFRDRAPDVRLAVAETLARLEDEGSAALVAAGLDDPEEGVRAKSVDAAVRRQGTVPVDRLVGMLRGDPSPLVRERAALAVGCLTPPGGEVALLTACHQEASVTVRAAAVLALGAYDQESLVARMLEMADEASLREVLRSRLHEDAEFRLLGLRLRDAAQVELRALAGTSREEMEATLAEGMRGVLSSGERIRLVAGLRAFQGERSRGALLAVVRGDPDPEVRAAALTAVGGMLDAADLHLVAHRALADPHRSVRHAAVALFQRLAPDRGLPGLLRLLQADEDPVICEAVAQQAEAAFPTFQELVLGLGPETVGTSVVLRVARHIHHPELRRLIGVLARSPERATRSGVASLWAARPDLVEVAALEPMAADPSPGLRCLAAAAWGAAREFERLATMVADPDPEVRREVARAFLPAPDTRALEPLFLDPDESVRAALYATRLLQGEWVEPPERYGVPRPAARDAVRQAGPLERLRDVARTAADPAHRQPAALALALLEDEAAWSVLRGDPVWAVREAVGRFLEGGQSPGGVTP